MGVKPFVYAGLRRFSGGDKILEHLFVQALNPLIFLAKIGGQNGDKIGDKWEKFCPQFSDNCLN